MAKARILVIDDEESPREALRHILKERYDLTLKADGPSALEAVRVEDPFEVALLDIMMPGMSGMDVLTGIRQNSPATAVVMATAINDAKTGMQAVRLGAADYLNKPFDVEQVRFVVDRVLKEQAKDREICRLRTELQSNYKFEHIVGSGPAMQKMYGLIQRLLDNESTVLITGETGTGKELVARALHYNGPRKEGPFMPVHCAAIPSELLESELFGHEKGSFTGAMQRRIGMFEAAGGGTLFLDEIGEMPHGTQSKLLRAIQEREIRRVGGQETIDINVRLVCATNRNLEEEVKRGRFREDLFYRINVVPITIPSLRERKEDIPQLVLHFTQRFAKELNREAPQFTAPAMDLLLAYPWPGNVRELEHAVERLLVTCDSNKIVVEDLPFVISQADVATAQIASRLTATTPSVNLGEKLEFDENGLDLPKITEDIERRAIEEALRRTGGVITEAARTLKITRRMLRYKMDKLNIVSGHEAEAEVPAESGEGAATAK
jgi:DNA-binding NtrC family response regulator